MSTSYQSWKELTVKTQTFGGSHGDTKLFDDLEYAKSVFNDDELPRIVKVEIYTDYQLAYGYRFFYSNNRTAPKHWGCHAKASVITYTYDFEPGEYIAKVFGRTGGICDQLSFITNTGRKMIGGGNGGGLGDTKIPDGCAVVGVGGGVGGHIHHYFAHYVDLSKISPIVKERFLNG